jgi:hypothetical protein
VILDGIRFSVIGRLILKLLYFESNHIITLPNLIHFFQQPKFETVPFTIQIFQKSPTATFTSSP